jgi:hypothetical protein
MTAKIQRPVDQCAAGEMLLAHHGRIIPTHHHLRLTCLRILGHRYYHLWQGSRQWNRPLRSMCKASDRWSVRHGPGSDPNLMGLSYGGLQGLHGKNALAASAARVALSMTSNVTPVAPTARYRYAQRIFTLVYVSPAR